MRKAKTAEKLRDKATELLDRCKVYEPPVPVDLIAKSLGAKIRLSPFEGELAGMLIRGQDEDTVIGVNSLHHINRQRFTIAHECGHLLLHKGEVHIDQSFRVNRRDEVSAQAIDPEEIEANRFAAELLMPYEMIKKDLIDFEIDMESEDELKELADRYEVSLQAMTHRVTNLLTDFF
ncbi:MAG: ImmA/IrrE family metallo-endopeptidase [Gammaproteobacteria bacterium]|jgi:Zn-dependent peptidase ImmA (M78 family)|nr:ImmA/IrrE family metallo-endopeptidase [Pseudomonadales bacterium]